MREKEAHELCIVCQAEEPLARLVTLLQWSQALPPKGHTFLACWDCVRHDTWLRTTLAKNHALLLGPATDFVRKEYFSVEDPETDEVKPAKPSWAHDERLAKPQPVRRIK